MSNSVDVEKMRESILKIRKKIEAAAEKSGRNPDDILLLGVTKTVDVDAMQAAFDLGIKDFENRVQEFVKNPI